MPQILRKELTSFLEVKSLLKTIWPTWFTIDLSSLC